MNVGRQFLNRAEMRLYHDAVVFANGWQQSLFYQAIAHTDFPVRDLTGMQWSQLDLTRRFWRHPWAKVELPLSDRMVALLNAHRDESCGDFAFGLGEPALDAILVAMSREHLAGYMRAIGPKASPPRTIRDWTFEDVCRTVVLELLEIGLTRDLARIATGRAAAGIAQIYNWHSESDEIRFAVNMHSRNIPL
jgi:hypothetical protein